MRKYGQTQCAMWGHPDFRALTDDGRLAALYLITGPHSNGLGCYRLPSLYMAADLDWTVERTEGALEDLEHRGWVKACSKTHFVLIPNFLKWNPISSSKVCVPRMAEFDDVPRDCILRPRLAAAMLGNCEFWTEEMRTRIERVAREAAPRGDTDRVSEQINTAADRVSVEAGDTLSDTGTEQNRTEQEQNRTEPNLADSVSADAEPLTLLPDVVPPPDPVLAKLPTVRNADPAFDVTASQVAKWAEAYPAVDVLGEINRMSAWLEANPKNGKTLAGMPAFAVRWLSKAQNDSKPGGFSGPGGSGVPLKTQRNAAALAEFMGSKPGERGNG